MLSTLPDDIFTNIAQSNSIFLRAEQPPHTCCVFSLAGTCLDVQPIASNRWNPLSISGRRSVSGPCLHLLFRAMIMDGSSQRNLRHAHVTWYYCSAKHYTFSRRSAKASGLQPFAKSLQPSFRVSSAFPATMGALSTFTKCIEFTSCSATKCNEILSLYRNKMRRTGSTEDKLKLMRYRSTESIG